VRKLAGMMAMVLLALLIAACGSDDSEETPTAEPAGETVSTTAPEDAATEAATEIATPETEAEVGTPVVMATPGAMATPSVARIEASPVAIASPVVMATPDDSSAIVAPVGGAADSATPVSGSGEMVTLRGEVTLPGTPGETYVIADNACVGLNGYSDMKAGRQLVVRDETGTIVGVTEIEASDATDACSWSFSLDVPQSAFYAVSVPMEVEHIFTQEEIEQSSGEITVPLS
jgi:hypothetical protein